MANTPVGATQDLNNLTLASGNNNTIKVTASAPSLYLDESDKSTLEVTVTNGTLDMDFKDDGTWKVIGLGNMKGAIEIPATWNGVDITEIGASAFEGKTELTGIIIPNTVKLIGDSAFEGSGIRFVQFKDKEEIIVYFKNTPGWLTPYASYNCESSGEDVYHSVEMIYLEEAQDNLYCINVPLDTISISFNPGNTSETTKPYSINYDTDLQPNSLYIPSRVGATNVYNCRVERFYAVPNNTHLHAKIPGGLRIGGDAFKNCTSLTEPLVIPRRTTWIGGDAFLGCENLYDCTYADYSWLTNLQGGAFKNCTRLGYAALPMGLATTGINVFYGCTSLESFSCPVTLTNLGKSMFEFCTALTNVHLSVGANRIEPRLKSIGERAFLGCVSLPEATSYDSPLRIPSSVAFIGAGAFRGAYVTDWPLYLKIDDVYTWFYSSSTNPANTESVGLLDPSGAWHQPDHLGMFLNGSFESQLVDSHLHKYKKMLPPTLSLDGDILTIKDNLGVAENFFIYIGENTDWSVQIRKNQINPMP